MTAVSDETGRDWLPLKYEDGPDFCTVTFATGAAFALTVHPERMKLMEAALSASPVGELTPEQISIQNDMFAAWVGDPKFREAFRNDCKRLLSVSLVAQEPVAWPKEEIEPGRFVDVDPDICGYRMPDETAIDPAAESKRPSGGAPSLTGGHAEAPPATPAGVGADEIARIIATKCFDPRVIDSSGKPFWKKSQWSEAQKAATAILALLSRDKLQS